ncbi:MAG TPA: C40 family peptidase [Burkholderiales bacterium]
MGTRAALGLCTALAALALAGCGGAPTRPDAAPAASRPAAEQAAGFALKMVGRPYRFGGSTPAGFDCSGLVQYSYRQAGVRLPRSTEAQLVTGTRVRLSSVRRGDLLFFDEEGKKKSHVGIYLGEGRFVHAPSSGKHVRTDSLDAPYWKKHFAEARRV